MCRGTFPIILLGVANATPTAKYVRHQVRVLNVSLHFFYKMEDVKGVLRAANSALVLVLAPHAC